MINAIILTKNNDLKSYVTSGKKVYPEDLIKKHNESITLNAINLIDGHDPRTTISNNVGTIDLNSNGVLIFVDDEEYSRFRDDFGMFFIISSLGNFSKHLQNKSELKQHLEDIITRSLKHFFWVKDNFGSGFNDILRLPIRNFNDDDLKEIFELIKNTPNNQDCTVDQLQQLLSETKKRIRKPKKRPHSSRKFYVDKKDFFFEAGHERHSRHETDTKKGHDIICDISAKYRFGCRVEEQKHYNVCKGDNATSSISGVFCGCHNDRVIKTKTTHLNMFCNDYIA